MSDQTETIESPAYRREGGVRDGREGERERERERESERERER